jgi:molecular chaperone DnaK
VKSAVEKLAESQGKLGEAIYASAQAETQASAEATTDEDVVDAEVVEDDESNEKADK